MNLCAQFLISFLLAFVIHSVHANEQQEFPVLYKGRYRPAEAYARLWLYEMYHSPTIKKEDLSAFKTTSSSPLTLLWALDILGPHPYQNAPLFWIGSAELKKKLGLNPTYNRFSYHELQPILQHMKEGTTLFDSVNEFEKLKGNLFLEQEYPLVQRLRQAGKLFRTLPSRYQEGEWFPLKALKVQIYQPSSQSLQPVGNFTLYSNEQFETIRQAYLALEKAFVERQPDVVLHNAESHLALTLAQAYTTLAGTIVKEAHSKQLTYPSLTQLKMETMYITFPWIPLLIFLYALGAGLLWIFHRQNSSLGQTVAMGIISMAILCHTALLAMRCYILERPPVSNMFETVIYVPWVAACFTLLFPSFRRQPLVILAACATAIGLLLILEVTDLNQNLDQVQAVLDSQFWLLIHVLLVVGSYGIFILGAVLGHFYLGLFMAHRQETVTMKQLSQVILQTLYGGTTLLIAGTILGGIWAAESWGRFWDWDPKESWAFISSCFYLIWIHAYRFHRIASFGLAIGAVSGLMAISFTWYGVNYILGTGLHTYGFGSGGEYYYYAFLVTECLFLAAAIWSYTLKNQFTLYSK